MSVDDHGLEVLKKAAIPLDPLNPKKEYVIRTTIVAGAGGTGLLTTEYTAVTVAANTWTTVPLLNINNIATVEVFDAIDTNRVLIEWRIVGGTQVQIRSANANTYTVHTIGYVL
jgi:hypothetical protein